MADKIIRICLDAGHYGNYNQSPANRSYYEAKAMWTLHLLLKKYLEGHGFEVVTTRAEQAKDLELTARGRMSTGCDLFISLHSNAVGSYVNEDVDYVVAYALTDDKTTKIDEISKEIGDDLVKVVADIMGTKQTPRVNTRLSDNDRNGDGVLNDNYYGVLHGARVVGTPAIILEHSFHTNTKATNWLLNESNLDRLAKAEAEVIAKYFGMTKKEDAPTPAPTPSEAPVKKYYRVRKSWEDAKSQLIACEVFENAKKNCPEGYTVYDWNGNAVYPIKNIEMPQKDATVLEWQNAAIADGFEFPIYGADGKWGDECRGVAKVAIIKERIVDGKWVWKYPNLTKLAQKLLGFTGDDIDGKCGSGTGNRIEYYQGQNGLKLDRCIGLLTWEDLLGV